MLTPQEKTRLADLHRIAEGDRTQAEKNEMRQLEQKETQG
jgi:hypothetical protein